MFQPRGHNDGALADPHDVVVLLPSVGPIFLGQRAYL